MQNFFDAVRSKSGVQRLEIGDFLFAQYTCGVGDDKVGFWAHTDYLVNVTSGKKTWQTADGDWLANQGETVFFKKGAAILNQHFGTDFCAFTFFIPDHLVRGTVKEIASSLGAIPAGVTPIRSAARVESDVTLLAFFESMRAYLAGGEKPSEPLLRLKIKELVVSILTSGRNPTLAAYFRALAKSNAPVLAEIMEENFRFNLSLEEYARLCHRSLSSFKRDFQDCFQEPPGQWLIRRRLDHAAGLLRASKMNVTEVAFESGFQDVSHFSRAFKSRFRISPLAFSQNPAS